MIINSKLNGLPGLIVQLTLYLIVCVKFGSADYFAD